MRNKLSFSNALFIALLYGKLSGQGRFATMSDWIIVLPIVLDFILDFVSSMGLQDKAIAWLRAKLIISKIKKTAKRSRINSKYP